MASHTCNCQIHVRRLLLERSDEYRFCLYDLQERAVAAFLGFAIGDALGATTEFMTPGEIRQQYGTLSEIRGGGWLGLPAGAVTDDTEMSICVARSIVGAGFSPVDIAQRFAAWLKTRPRDVGATCRRGIRRFITDGTLCARPSEMDGGNGAAMRMTPIALATIGDPVILAEWSVRQAHITHHHPWSDAACLLIGQMLHLALEGHGKSRLLALASDFVRHFPVFAYDRQPIYSSAYVVDTLRTVLRAFFSTGDFESCVVTVVNWGGDADTAGAIAGAIAGAYYGLSAIPTRWTSQLDPKVRQEVKGLAARLVWLSPVASSSGQKPVPRRFLHQALAACAECSNAPPVHG